MAKAELGNKRICPNCGTRYYDLNRDPIVCPRCGAHFEAGTTTARARPQAAADEDDEEVIETEAETEAEFVPLEDADDEAADTGAVKIEGEEDEEIEDEEDDTFLEEEDEEGDDVADIIGDVDDEER